MCLQPCSLTATVRASYSDQDVFVSTQTSLDWKTTVTLSVTPVPMSRRAAERVLAIANRDDSLSNRRIEDES